MNPVAVKNLDETLVAWEMYSSGEYEALLDHFSESKNSEIRDLHLLASLEQKQPVPVAGKNESLFSPLVKGVNAHLNGDHKLAASLLGSWFLNKDYYSAEMIRKFVISAQHSANYTLLHAVCKKLSSIPAYGEMIVEPTFLALYHERKYQECIQFFELHRERLVSEEIVQKAAFVLIQTNRFEDAERLLVSLYERLTGKHYTLDYERIKKSYEPFIRSIPELQRKKGRNFEDSLKLGLAYLFNENYSDALAIFETIEQNEG